MALSMSLKNFLQLLVLFAQFTSPSARRYHIVIVHIQIWIGNVDVIIVIVIIVLIIIIIVLQEKKKEIQGSKVRI